jgi:hypothetical protein
MEPPPVKQKSGCFFTLAKVFLAVFILGLVAIYLANRPTVPEQAPQANSRPAASNPPTAPKVAPPPTVHFQEIAADRRRWPQNVILKSSLVLPIVFNGKEAGNVTLPAGATVQLVAVNPDGTLVVAQNGNQTKISADKTDLLDEIAAIQKNAQVREQQAAQAKIAAVDAVNYTIVKRWSLPNGGEGKVIVISPAAANEAQMTLLGDRLRRDTQNDRNAFVYIFNDPQAAEMRDRLSSLTDAESKFYSIHFVGTYMRNANNGVHEMEIQPAGMDGPTKKLSF